jgi:hypothetical protein
MGSRISAIALGLILFLQANVRSAEAQSFGYEWNDARSRWAGDWNRGYGRDSLRRNAVRPRYGAGLRGMYGWGYDRFGDWRYNESPFGNWRWEADPWGDWRWGGPSRTTTSVRWGVR